MLRSYHIKEEHVPHLLYHRRLVIPGIFVPGVVYKKRKDYPNWQNRFPKPMVKAFIQLDEQVKNGQISFFEHVFYCGCGRVVLSEPVEKAFFSILNGPKREKAAIKSCDVARAAEDDDSFGLEFLFL